MVVLVDDTLNESLRTFRIDLGIPDESPDSRVAGIPERPSDLLAADQAPHADFVLCQLELGVAFQGVHEIPPVEVQDDGRRFLGFCRRQGRSKIGRAEWHRRLTEELHLVRSRRLDNGLRGGLSIERARRNHEPARSVGLDQLRHDGLRHHLCVGHEDKGVRIAGGSRQFRQRCTGHHEQLVLLLRQRADRQGTIAVEGAHEHIDTIFLDKFRRHLHGGFRIRGIVRFENRHRPP